MGSWTRPSQYSQESVFSFSSSALPSDAQALVPIGHLDPGPESQILTYLKGMKLNSEGWISDFCSPNISNDPVTVPGRWLDLLGNNYISGFVMSYSPHWILLSNEFSSGSEITPGARSHAMSPHCQLPSGQP